MEHFIDLIAKSIEGLGIGVIFLGTIYALVRYLISMFQKEKSCYFQLRKTLGKSILLGLEILIAADIIATVITEPTLRSVSVLGLIVLIRTFLSLSIQIEIEGKFPWQKKSNAALHDD